MLRRTMRFPSAPGPREAARIVADSRAERKSMLVRDATKGSLRGLDDEDRELLDVVGREHVDDAEVRLAAAAVDDRPERPVGAT